MTKTFSNFALEFKTAREKVIDNAARLKRKKEKERAPRRIPQNFEVRKLGLYDGGEKELFVL